jgi:hypothetical protein
MWSQRFLAQLSFALVLLGVAGPCTAENAPAPLRGKSIVTSWTENRQQRLQNESTFRPRNLPQSLQIYVSNEGRTFERRSEGPWKREGVGGGAIGAGSSSSRFHGNTLVIAGQTAVSGARQVLVIFDSSFSSCSVKVQIGYAAGQSSVKSKNPVDGRAVEWRLESITGESCAIQSGNVFAP